MNGRKTRVRREEEEEERGKDDKGGKLGNGEKRKET